MEHRSEISARQLSILVIMNVTGTSILTIPSILAMEAKQDAWLAAILALLLTLPILFLYLALHKKHPMKILTEIFEAVLGKWVGKITSLLFIMIYPVLLSALTLMGMGGFVHQTMPETPIGAIYVIFILVVIYAVKLGIESISRTAEILVAISLFLLAFMFISLIPQVHIEHLLPILEDGFKPVIRGAVPLMSFSFLELVLFLLIFPHANEQAKVRKALLSGAFIGWSLLFLITILSILVLGLEITSSETYPSYALAKKISIGKFFERVESTIAFAWFFTCFIKMCTYFYLIVYGLAQTLNLKDSKFLIIPLGILIVNVALFFVANSSYMINFSRTIFPFFNLTFGLALPLLLLAATLVKGYLRKE
ncbi:endospore germination permease [Paenibacillus sp. LHD-38]|uniref:GerAB/ArcD/ProY family transporter n=1 Tax=Paenibacillus sp. LHD-38 TaxID=3072143 RepID=UPI00280E23F8|nr:endospore germination permease [Paenibacillus sp. LHD-38]MDQ8737245.1 endospore germination permease [Paenibacillus sp. LHD-38]